MMFGKRLIALGVSSMFVVVGCSTQSADTPQTTAINHAPSSALASRAITTAPPAPNTLETRPRRMGDIEYIRYADEPMKPANRSLKAFLPGKADAADDVRFFAPDHYAITEAPPEGIRPMVEWEPMTAITMSVPTYMTQGNYANSFGTIVDIAKHSATVAEVWFLVSDEIAKDNITQGMLDAGSPQADVDDKVKFLIKPNETVWMIDFGPLPIINAANDSYAFTDFRYYHDRAIDDGVPTLMGRNLINIDQPSNVETYRMPLNSEGGTFQATEDGVCFTGDGQLFWMSYDTGSPDYTIWDKSLEELQTHPNALKVKEVWAEYAGCEDVIITHSVSDDATLHIDMYMKVLSNNAVLMGEYGDGPFNDATAAADNAARMDANAEFIANYVKPDGTNFEVKRLIMPGHRQTSDGWAPFTYANSTMINGLNLWPAYTFDDWVDSRNQAEAEWEAALPDYEHIWIDSEELAFWSGAIHCITRTIPNKTPSLWVGDGTCADDMCTAPAGGYDGDCTPNDIEYEVCYGPEWLCSCNDCDTACDYEPGEPPAADLCSEVECGSYAPNNGISCSCDEACVQYNDCCSDACDTCGFNCDGTEPPPPTGCNGVTYEGCCDGQVLTWCENDALETIDCAGLDNLSCGWNTEDGFYNCGTDGSAEPTGTHPIACPGGTGDSCTPDCSGKACGDDGCGGSCGTCEAGTLCTNAGTCVELCVPDCADKTCGDDGCGGSCGTCAGDAPFCSDGNCIADCTPACDGAVCGDDGCGGSCGDCAEGEACDSGACAACTPSCDGKACGDDGCGGSCGTCGQGESCTTGGQCVTLCTADCTGKVCGGDGCGGSCGTCDAGQSCTSGGQCVADCQPNCAGKNCGDDGCGGSCGTCAFGDSCDDTGNCATACVPNCLDKACGDDGCGGSCGTCSATETCNVDGACEASPSDRADAAGSGDDATTGGETGPVDPNLPIDPNGTGTVGPGDGTEPGLGDGSETGDAASGCQGGEQSTLPWFMALLLGTVAVFRRRPAVS